MSTSQRLADQYGASAEQANDEPGRSPGSVLVFARLVFARIFLGRVLVIGAVRDALLARRGLPRFVRATITARLVRLLLGDVGFGIRFFRIHAERRASGMPPALGLHR